MKTILTEAEVQAGVKQLAASITALYGEQPLTIIGLMTGSIVLQADLIRLLKMPLRVGVVQASSYRQGTERQALIINCDLMPEIAGREVLVLDDIFDTGHTLAEVLGRLRGMGPASLRAAVLLRKTARQQVDLEPDFVVFEIPDEFVVGYGLDYCDQYRNLPYIAALEPADIVRS